MPDSLRHDEDDSYPYDSSTMPTVATVVALPLCELDFLAGYGLFAYSMTCTGGAGSSDCGAARTLAFLLAVLPLLGLVTLVASWRHRRDGPQSIRFGLATLLLTGAPLAILILYLTQS